VTDATVPPLVRHVEQEITPVALREIGDVAATATVPSLFGKVIILSPSKEAIVSDSSLASSVSPSKTKEVLLS
jgi:hypothetical protein